MLKYNVFKTRLKIVLLNWQNTAQEKWKKGTQAHFIKMVKMLYLALKTITQQKMRWKLVNTVSGITHTKFQGSAQEK